MSFLEMHSHALRSTLSILGVMLGVASLVAMLTLVAGIDIFLNEKMGRWAGFVMFFTRHDVPDEEKISWSRSGGMKFSDGQYLKDNSSDVNYTYKTIERRSTVSVCGSAVKSRVRGMDRKTLEEDMENMEIESGSWFCDEDYNEGNNVCIVSWQQNETLLKIMSMTNKKTKSIIGKELVFKSKRFIIKGVFAPNDPDFKPWHLRRSVYIPIKAMQKYITGIDPHPGRIRLSVNNPEEIIKQAQKISLILKSRHRGVEDFEYRTAEWLEEIRSLLTNISLLMTIISIISLLVGGLSIMNVMLSSISERIHEIGIRKALGAQKLQIFMQFITETVVLSLTGGIIGIFIGMFPLLFSEQIKKATEGAIEPTIVFVHVIYVFLIIVAVGIFFGLYPAVKASRMNPIEALRYE